MIAGRSCWAGPSGALPYLTTTRTSVKEAGELRGSLEESHRRRRPRCAARTAGCSCSLWHRFTHPSTYRVCCTCLAATVRRARTNWGGKAYPAHRRCSVCSGASAHAQHAPYPAPLLRTLHSWRVLRRQAPAAAATEPSAAADAAATAQPVVEPVVEPPLPPDPPATAAAAALEAVRWNRAARSCWARSQRRLH